ncbi:MAG: DUF1684 domain-containing protein [Myxococcota bacterium]
MLSLISMLIGCGDGLTLPPGWTVVEATAFQRQHEAEIATPTGPLSSVASYYVGPGQALVLGVVEGAVVPVPVQEPGQAGPPGSRVRIEVTDAGARCLEGCGPGAVALTERREVSLDRFTLGLSPQSGTLRILVHDPRAPALAGFTGLPWFPVDPRFIVPARWEPDPQRPTVELSTSRGLHKTFVQAGVLRARVGGEDLALVGYSSGASGALLVPLTDATTGVKTYPVGRYLQVTVPPQGPAVLDFNRLTNPWCAYSEHYNCPVPPSANRLTLAVEAGEQVDATH